VRGRFYSRPTFTTYGDGRVELVAPLHYRLSKARWSTRYREWIEEVTVPAGFVCDLASVPHWLASIAPSWNQTAGAGIIHDFAYRRGIFSRREADAVFYEALRAQPATGRFRAWCMWSAVRAFGWGAWTCNRIAEAP
jgi:hypothetical protein